MARINYLGGLTKGAKFQIRAHSALSGRWGEIYSTWGFLYFLYLFLPTFFSTPSGRTARQTAEPSVPKHAFPCKEVPFVGLVGTLPFWGILGAKAPNFGGPR